MLSITVSFAQVFTDFEGNQNLTFTGWPNAPQQVFNSFQSGINVSDSIGLWARGGEQWAHCYADLASDLDLSTNNIFELKVYSPIASSVLLKLEDQAGTPPVEISLNISTPNTWELLSFDFSFAQSGVYDKIIIFFDIASFGTDTFYFDDLELIAPTGTVLNQIDLPVTFEDVTVDYTVTDFGNNATVLGADPLNSSNVVAITTKGVTAETWAGTTISTAAGFANAIPFTADATIMSILVYSPDAGIPVRLKVEDAANGGIYVETEALTTIANAWDTLEFDFSNQVTATPALNLVNTYDKASIFFNFGTDGATAGSKTYYWDNVEFLPPDTTGTPSSTSAYCETYTTHFNIPAEVNSGINLTITNVDATSMYVEIESATADPVNFLLVSGGSGATISDPDTSVAGKIRRTLTWSVPPADVVLNILWSKLTFGGNWQLSQADITVPFAANCENITIPLSQMDLPVNFDDTTVNYSTIDFGGTASIFMTDPAGGTNQVVQTTKGVGAETWAGTTLATAGPPEEGFANAIPFTATQAKMTIKVFSPSVGTPVMLKIEDETNPGIFAETQDTTTVANAWETLTFDYSATTGGSFSITNTYDKAVIFFNFGTAGAGEIYYWDDVEFDNTVVVNPSYTIFTDFDANENEEFTGWPIPTVKVANPYPSGINTSDSVGCWARGGDQWAHAYSDLSTPIDFSTYQAIEAKVYSPISCTVLCKLESSLGALPLEVSMNISGVNTWETLSFNFTGATSGVYDKLILFFDFATWGTDTFYFDDVQLAAASLAQVDLPVDFESSTVDYLLVDFGSTSTVLGTDPVGGANIVAITTKNAGAETWAGTTIGGNGFATAIPFTAIDNKMSVKVYSPAIGTPILLKVEDHLDPTHSCETQSLTTVANGWETILFDFTNNAVGTTALDLSWTYDKASIFFDFGSYGAGDVFYWDDVEFVPFTAEPVDLPITFDDAAVDYTFETWGGDIAELVVDPVDPTNMVAKTIKATGAETWSGAAVVGNSSGLANPIPFTATQTQMSMRVYSPAIGIPILMKVEDKTNGGISSETLEYTTVENAWETIVFDLANGTPALNLSNVYDKIAVFFNFGNYGTGNEYYWDDIEFVDTTVVNPTYTIFNDFDMNENEVFEGWPNFPMKVANPSMTGLNTSDSVAQWVRGFEQYSHVYSNLQTTVDFSTYEYIHVKVYSPIACTALLKLETQSGTGGFVENSQNITFVNGWQELVFDFTGASSGLYDKMVLFLDFASFADNTFYIDDIELGEAPLVSYENFDDASGLVWGFWDGQAGGDFDVEAMNPNTVGNISQKVGDFYKSATSSEWTHSFAILGDKLDLSESNTFQMKVYSESIVTFSFKLQNNELTEPWTTEVTANYTVSDTNNWEIAVLDFSSAANRTDLDKLVIMVNSGVVMEGNYFVDDIEGPAFTLPATSPVLDEAEVATDGMTLKLKFDDAMEQNPLNAENFVVMVDGAANAVVSTALDALNDSIIDLTVTDIIESSSIVLVSYLQSGTITSVINGVLEVFTDELATNNSSYVSQVTQSVNFSTGWTIFSTYVDVFEPLLDSVFAPVVSELVLVKNSVGSIYWPLFNINVIGSLTIGEGYYAKFNTPQSVDFVGLPVQPEATPLSIDQGWSIIAYLRTSSADATQMFSSIENDITIVKNTNGLVYWPTYGINGIGNLNPGEGYQIKLINAVVFTYPANATSNFAKSDFISPDYYKQNIVTGSNMTIGFPNDCWDFNINSGDQIGAFDKEDQLIGSAVYNNKNLALTVWGKTNLDNEGIELGDDIVLKYWSKQLNREFVIDIKDWKTGNSSYSDNGISVVAKSSIQEQLFVESYPNPASTKFNINLNVEETQLVQINIYNVLGVQVDQIVNATLESRNYNFELDLDNYTSGSYFFKVKIGNEVMSDKFQVVK